MNVMNFINIFYKPCQLDPTRDKENANIYHSNRGNLTASAFIIL